MTKAIVLDFDGVIVRDSERFKQEAWSVVFASYGQAYEGPFAVAERAYGRGRGGDRFDILRDVYHELGEPATAIPGLVEAGAKQFDTLVQERIARTGMDTEDEHALRILASSWPLYVNSATPSPALEATITRLGIGEYFSGVFGRPGGKQENLKRVAAHARVSPSELLFIGDSAADGDAARAVGCAFLAVGTGWPVDVLAVSTLAAVPAYLQHAHA